MVKYLMRVVAVWLGLYLLVPILLLARLAQDAFRSGRVSDWTVVLIATVVALGALGFIGAAAIAIPRLWRLQEAGRRTARTLAAIVFLSIFASVLLGRNEPASSWGYVLLTLVPVLVLVSPAAKRSCH